MADFAALAARVAALEATTPADTGWPEWMNLETAAAYLDSSPERIRKLVARREIPYHQEAPGCRLSFKRHDLDQHMRTQRIEPRE
jgi:excisionase family DNA binding protein